MFLLGKRLKKPLLLSGGKWLILAFFGLILLVFAYHFVFLPVRYRPVIRAIEQASTSAAESNAFHRASKIGQIWEVEYATDPEYSNKVARPRPGGGELLLKIEWLDSDFRGIPFRAYRKVIDTNNIAVLYKPVVRKTPQPLEK